MPPVPFRPAPPATRTATILRLLVATLVAVTLLPLTRHAEAATTQTISASPARAKPGALVTVSGTLSRCPMAAYQTVQNYTGFNGNYVQEPGAGGVTDGAGHFSFTAIVPNGAVRSNIFRPFSNFQYDTVIVKFPSCGSRALGVPVTVLPRNHRVSLTVTPASPRSGRVVHVTATHCVHGPLAEFTQLVDRTGEYFHFTGSVSSGTWTGSANLAHGFYGAFASGGPAHVSAPGAKDAVISIPCVQNDGPKALADRLWHSTVAVDVHIRPRT